MGVSFNGCEKIKSLADVKFDVEFTADLPVTVSAEGQLKSLGNEMALYPFYKKVTIDPLSNEDVAEYSAKITGWAITGVELKVKAVGEVDVVVSDVNLAVIYGNTTALFHIDSWILNVGETHPFYDTDGNFGKLVKILNDSLDDENPFEVYIAGDSNKQPVDILFTYIQAVKVTANPL